MNSFTLMAVGNLARNPEAVAKGDMTYTRFCLVGNDYAGKDDEGAPREIVTSLWFVAFGALGEALVHNTRKGDQLIVEARVRANNWTDKQGDKQYDLDFVVQGFRFGAPGKIKREERAARRETNGHSNSESLVGPDMSGDGSKDRTGSGLIGDVGKDRTGSVLAGDAGKDQTGPGSNGDATKDHGSPGSSGASGPSGAAGAGGNSVEKPSGSRSRRTAASAP